MRISSKIVIIDYGMGNLHSVLKKISLYEKSVSLSSDIEVISNADKLILPGVGNFGQAMQNIKDLGIFDIINKRVLQDKIPILGICLGMQIMTSYSEEGDADGFNWIEARVKKFNPKNRLKFKVPQIGWNNLDIISDSKLLLDMSKTDEFYFVHSFFVTEINDKFVVAKSNYEIDYCSCFEKENIYGVQFHPEKSHESGKKVIQNFMNI